MAMKEGGARGGSAARPLCSRGLATLGLQGQRPTLAEAGPRQRLGTEVVGAALWPARAAHPPVVFGPALPLHPQRLWGELPVMPRASNCHALVLPFFTNVDVVCALLLEW
ncbi:hypothetical protein ABPG75_005806 [Micractinium tetrahymenae]